MAAVVSLLKTDGDAACVDILTGAREALRGRKHVARPEGWPEAFAGLVARRDLNVIEQALLLGLDFDEPKAIACCGGWPWTRKPRPDERSRMLAALVERACRSLRPTFKP